MSKIGRFGEYGGQYVPEIVMNAVNELNEAYEKYKNDPYRAVNFKRDEKGNIICPNERKFKFKETRHIRGNQYGRTEPIENLV